MHAAVSTNSDRKRFRYAEAGAKRPLYSPRHAGRHTKGSPCRARRAETCVEHRACRPQTATTCTKDGWCRFRYAETYAKGRSSRLRRAGTCGEGYSCRSWRDITARIVDEFPHEAHGQSRQVNRSLAIDGRSESNWRAEPYPLPRHWRWKTFSDVASVQHA
jgi:hypothetical protein